MYEANTSKAIGTGRNVPITATSTMPKNVTCVGTQLCGSNWIHRAPRRAASSISGSDVRSRYQRLFRKLVPVNIAADVHDSSAPSKDSPTEVGTFLTAAAKRGNTKNNNANVSPIFSTASCMGNNVNSKASTTMFKVGEVNIVASADS